MSDPQQQHPPPHPPNHQENQENLGTNGTTITPAAAIGDQYSHDFKRDRNCDFCYVCQNYWPTNTKVVSPFNSCSICGITVHTSCLSIAKCYHSCEANAVHHKYTTSELNSLNNAGKFFVKLKHVYDIVGQSGVVLYGIVRLSSNKHFLTTEQAIVRDQDCVWNEETKGRYLKYKVESSDQPALTGGFLEIEVWKSVFSVFDTLVGSSRISIIPLLIHQNKVIERWFELRTSEGEIFGTLLVKLNYIRDEGNSQLNKIENLNTEYQQTEDNKVVVTPEVAPLKPIEALDIAEKLTPERKQVPKPRQLEQLPPEKEQPIPPKTPYVSNSTASAKSLNGFKLDPSVMQDIQNAANAGGSKVKFSPLHDNKAPPSFAPISKRNIEVHKTVSDMQSQGNKTFTTEPSDVADNETSSTISEASLNIWERVSGALSGAKKSGLYVYNSLLNENIRTRLSKPNNSKIDISKSIGVLYVNLASAYVENAHDAAEGDYYVMVSLIAGTPEDDLDEFTHVVKESASPVFNKKIEFPVKHFRCMLRVILIESPTERKIGYANVPIYWILQRDADKYECKWDASPFENIEMKSMNGSDSTGHFSVQIHFLEDTYGLFGASEPKSAPDPPEEQMSLERVRTHIARFSGVIDSYLTLYRNYRYLMGWENKPFTFIVLVLFVVTTITVKAEYALCVPFFVIVLLLTISLFHRKSGAFQKKFVQTKDNLELLPYRPVMIIRLAIAGYRVVNAQAKLLPLPAFCRITLLTTSNYLNNETKANKKKAKQQSEENPVPVELLISSFPISLTGIASSSNAAKFQFTKASTNALTDFLSALNLTKNESTNKSTIFQNLSDPWPRSKQAKEMLITHHDNAIVAHANDESTDISFLYPVLKPVDTILSASSRIEPKKAEDADDSEAESNELYSDDEHQEEKGVATWSSWRNMDGSIKMTLYGDNPNSSFIDNTWGSAQIDLKDLVKFVESKNLQTEYCKWINIESSTGQIQKLKGSEDNIDPTKEDIKSNHSRNGQSKSHPNIHAQVLVRVRIEKIQSGVDPSNGEVETSRAIQAIIVPQVVKEETTISAIWNARDHIKFVQNLLGNILDNVESFKNIFNWTIPSKTFPLYLGLVVIWLSTICIPGRYLILLVGLLEFFYIFLPQPEEIPIVVKYFNLLKSLPNDDDLSEYYKADRNQNMMKKAENRRKEWKKLKLETFLPTQWEGAVKLKVATSTSGGSDIIISASGAVWTSVHLVVQGHRMIWWSSELDIDEGKAPLGELLLHGHSGTTHSSPVDTKEMGANRLVTVFGRDIAAVPQRRTFLCRDAATAEELAGIVNKISNAES